MPKKKEELEVTAAAETAESGVEVANLEDQAPEASTEISETANEDAVKPKRTRKKKTDSVDEKTLSEAGPSSVLVNVFCNIWFEKITIYILPGRVSSNHYKNGGGYGYTIHTHIC